MGLFGKSDDSGNSGSLWNRLTKPRKQLQKSPANSAPTNQPYEQQQKHHNKIKTCVNRLPEDPRKDNFRLSFPSLRVKTPNTSATASQNRSPGPGTDQLDSRLRTSKLQCEQLKKKVAVISAECSKLESQCGELRDLKEQLLTFQSDMTMLKQKEKIFSEIQQKIAHLEEENCIMIDEIEHLRVKLSELKTELNPEFVHKRLDQLESDSHKLTSITLQNRRDHDRFSLDVGSQLVETFVTQQTIYEEFRRLQHRLVSVERQNQIMSDLIHFHCHNSVRAGNHLVMTNSISTKGAVSLQASTEAASVSFSPTFSDQDAEKIYTSPTNIDWQITDQGDSLFLDDTLNKSSERNHKLIIGDDKNRNYYKIDFTSKSESFTTLHMTDLSTTLSESIMSAEEIENSTNSLVTYDLNPGDHVRASNEPSQFRKCVCDVQEPFCTTSQPRDDGYYSTSHDGTMATDSVFNQGTSTTFHDDKERYLILTRHVQKSRGRSLRSLPLSNPNCVMVIKSSMDLETQVFNRHLRQRQRKQRESQSLDEDDMTQVFSDTELYGTRFCIDSDIDEEENVDIFHVNKMISLKRSFAQKTIKVETKHVSNLPPLIEHVSERERKIEIKSTKKSKIVPPKVHPKRIMQENPISEKFTSSREKVSESKQSLCVKPPKYIPSTKIKTKTSTPSKSVVTLVSPKKIPVKSYNTEAPPVPPRPKKRLELRMPDIEFRDVPSLDYVNHSIIRLSPEGCPDIPSSNSQMVNKFRDCCSAPTRLSDNFSPTSDDCYNEDEEDVQILRPDHYPDFYDQEFIFELENYQLPKSTVSMLVMQHFK